MEFDDEGIPVDPESGSVISLNKGRLNSYREARERAMEEIISAVKEVRVDGEYLVVDLIKNNDDFQRKLYGVVSSKIRYHEYPVDFRTSGCKATLSISNILAVLPYQYQSEDFPGRIDMPVSTYYTSVIVDTRRIKAQPMVSPSIYNENGLEIYGRNYVDINSAVRYGMVTYVNTVSEAMKHSRAGEHPYYTIALKKLNGCPVIADKDVKKIYGNDDTLMELRKCRVIFIIRKDNEKSVQP